MIGNSKKFVSFNDPDCAKLAIKSSWRSNKPPRSLSVQTEDIYLYECEIQTDFSSMLNSYSVENEACRNVDVQTDNLVDVMGGMINDNVFSSEEEESSLKQFLDRMIPLMLGQLTENENSHAFDDYDVNWSEEIDSISCLHQLQLPESVRSKYKQKPLACTDISWNSTGNLLAVSYGRINHVGWCLESGYIAIWNIYDVNSPDQPYVIEVEESYAMKVAFHPLSHNMLGVGTYDGSIKVYSLHLDTGSDTLMASSQISNSSHRDAINSLIWLSHRKDRSKTLLCSMGGDGKILLWDPEGSMAQPIAGYSFCYPNKSIPLGGSCLSFVNIHAGTNLARKYFVSTDDHFIVGTQIGEVHKAIFSHSSLIEARDTKMNTPLKIRQSSLAFSFDTSIGFVHNVDSSPWDKNVFLTCSSNGMVQVYNVYQKQDIIAVQPSGDQQFLYDAKWSPFRPLVFACVSNDGHLFFYDLDHSMADPVADIHVNEDSTALTVVRFSPKFKEYLVTGDVRGIVKVWQLNDMLSTMQSKEIQKSKYLFQTVN